jgi:hypothetical protein
MFVEKLVGALERVRYIKCEGGRKGSVMRFVTNQARNIDKLFLPIGSSGRIVLYNATKDILPEEAAVMCAMNFLY